MGIFGDKKKREKKKSTNQVEKTKTVERPRICCIDTDKEVISTLEKAGMNLSLGSLGSKIKVPNSTRRENHQLLPNHNFPLNLHELDIFVMDLDSFETIDYNEEEHIRAMHTGKSSYSLLSSFPETLFDPRPIASSLLKEEFYKITNREYLVIAFSSSNYEVEYEPIMVTEGNARRQGIEKHSIYSFWNYIPCQEPKYGKEITVYKSIDDLQRLLEKYKSNLYYNQTFEHPTRWNGGENEKYENYFPLITNINGDIVSYVEINKFNNLIVFPQIEDKANFLLEFLSKIAPSIFPGLFPYSTTFDWRKQEEYWLPNFAELLDDKKVIEKDYKEKLARNASKIITNNKKHGFLHELITETGDELVNAVIKFLNWLEFKNAKDFDTENGSVILEEDIQVDIPEGLLIIECKGIGGTSTDGDCSQISKIKHRRCKQRNAFDVFALYLVNHQRYQPPLKRQNPPFTEHQIQDAINDERGLLTTWQLYQLYDLVQKGILSKEDARNTFKNYGLVEFKPQNLEFIDEPLELFENGKICIVNIKDCSLSINEEILIEKNGKFYKSEIIDIQLNGSSVKNAKEGELGIKLSIPIKKKSILWKKSSR
ncbi:hypothetical protein [Lacinutrix sp. Bg11-31]|uniref:hypothetical protein n=1 Tax=Lacinutrix sp. Bg11-31 TaxID=2057808 RepID=UPI000C302A57|nr:hypothetical protein [Lacinutrix sp. Bg11-31]AUC80665.1 hypothetical protein CW733_00335 [Lacinutrix sp. Bg11-31]